MIPRRGRSSGVPDGHEVSDGYEKTLRDGKLLYTKESDVGGEDNARSSTRGSGSRKNVNADVNADTNADTNVPSVLTIIPISNNNNNNVSNGSDAVVVSPSCGSGSGSGATRTIRKLADILAGPASTGLPPVAAAAPGKRKGAPGNERPFSPEEARRLAPGCLVHPSRIRILKTADTPDIPEQGPVVYMMFRDQRVRDNWALLYAVQQAKRTGAPVAVVFTALSSLLGAGARQYDFMFRGLREVAARLERLGVPFFFYRGHPPETTCALLRAVRASLLVCDYSPIRIQRNWIEEIVSRTPVPVHLVDAHNVVPVWVASDKREVGARTLRPKIHRLLPEFMHEFPEIPPVAPWNLDLVPNPINWTELLREYREFGGKVPPVRWITPGEEAARVALMDPRTGFLSNDRIRRYDTLRNDPAKDAVSGLSPYLHFGQLSAQRAAMEAAKLREKHRSAVDSFLEELVVRRELADNFCHYCPDSYDNLSCAAGWAKETLDVHRGDRREHVYSRADLEAGRTHDELWNACQLQMTRLGKMHGFMRMYWAKKILEWTKTPEEAVQVAIEMNDTYEIDGRDPNGYTGVLWSMAGVHDQGWGERPVFGKIRYMNYAGCKRKFDIVAYCSYVKKSIAADQKAAQVAAAEEEARGLQPDDIWTWKGKNISATGSGSETREAGASVRPEVENCKGAGAEEEEALRKRVKKAPLEVKEEVFGRETGGCHIRSLDSGGAGLLRRWNRDSEPQMWRASELSLGHGRDNDMQESGDRLARLEVKTEPPGG